MRVRELPFNDEETAYMRAFVDCVNRANAAGVALFDAYAPYFANKKGCKVTKKDGNLLEAIKKDLLAIQLPVQPGDLDPNLRIFHSHGAYNLTWTVKTCKNYDFTRTRPDYSEDMEDHDAPVPTISEPYSSTAYYERVIYLARVQDHVLVNIYDRPTELRTDFTLEELLQLYTIEDAAKKAAEAAHDAVPYPFKLRGHGY